MDVYCYKIVRIGSVEYFRSEGLSNRAASGAVSARSRADEWLEETLRTSLSLGSPLKTINAQFNSGVSSECTFQSSNISLLLVMKGRERRFTAAAEWIRY